MLTSPTVHMARGAGGEGSNGGDAEKSGFLLKRSRLGWCWHRRWVRAIHGELEIRNRANDKAKMTIPLEFATVSLHNGGRGRYRFELRTALGATYMFAAESPSNANEWVKHLKWQISPIQRRSRHHEERPSRLESDPIGNVQREISPPTQQIGDDDDDAPGSVSAAGPGAAWNESYQSILEMDEHTFNMSVAKARQLNQLTGEFVSAAARLGKTIIEEFTLPPHLKSIHPMDRQDQAPEDETFMAEGIVFQFMHDPDGNALQDEAKKKMASHDLHGVTAYANAATVAKGLHTYLCCLVDYFGFRLFALALAPIYDDSIAFGVVGDTLRVEEDAEELLEQAAQVLNLRGHEVLVNHNEHSPSPVRIYTSSTLQMHRGEDGRLYITNSARIFPRDDQPRAHLRSDNEIVAATRLLRREFLRGYRKPLSSDAQILRGTEDADACTVDATKASRYLRGHVVPEFVKDLNMLRFVPIDSVHMTDLMHHYGINARYLGVIAELTLLPHVREMAICEMIARVCKQILAQQLRGMIRESNTSRHAGVEEYTEPMNQKLKQISRAIRHRCLEVILECFNLVLGHGKDSTGFWKGIMYQQLQSKFDYVLPKVEAKRLHRPLLFASLQHHCGVSFANGGAHIEFSKDEERPLMLRHIEEVLGRWKYPQIDSLKCHEFPCKADEYLEQEEWDMAIQAYQLRLDVMLPHCHSSGDNDASIGSGSRSLPLPPSQRMSQSQHDSWSLCASKYHHTLNLLCEAYMGKGDISSARDCARRALEASSTNTAGAHTAITYAHLVSIYRAMRHEDLAGRSFKIALSMMRRLYGPHSPLILRLYDEVGARYLEAGESQLAESHFRQSIELALTALGKSHPTTAQFYTRLGNVYHLEHCLDRAKDAHEKACLIYEGLYGPASLEVARSCFYLSDILSLKGDLRSARYYNQRALKIRLQLLGDAHPITLDSYHQVAWQAHRREDHKEAIPYFEKLLARFKSITDPDPDILVDIKKMTKAVIRLQMRSLPMDLVAFLDRLYQESHARVEESSALMRLVIRKLYDESPSAYVQELLDKSSKGLKEPGYASATAELAVILKLMESGSDDDDEPSNTRTDDKRDGSVTDSFELTVDSETQPALMNYSIAMEQPKPDLDPSLNPKETNVNVQRKLHMPSGEITRGEEGEREKEREQAYFMNNRPNTIVKS